MKKFGENFGPYCKMNIKLVYQLNILFIYLARGIIKGALQKAVRKVVQKKFLRCPGINIYLDFQCTSFKVIKDYQLNNCDINSYVYIVYHSEAY